VYPVNAVIALKVTRAVSMRDRTERYNQSVVIMRATQVVLVDGAATIPAYGAGEVSVPAALVLPNASPRHAICSTGGVTRGRHSVRSSPKRVMPVVMVTSGKAEKLRRAWLV